MKIPKHIIATQHGNISQSDTINKCPAHSYQKATLTYTIFLFTILIPYISVQSNTFIFLREAGSLSDLLCSKTHSAVQPQKRARLAAPTQPRHSSHWQDAVSYIAFIGYPMK